MTAEWDPRVITPWPIAENFGGRRPPQQVDESRMKPRGRSCSHPGVPSASDDNFPTQRDAVF